MPKKPNGSGGMQEYIPAGNGDASGEYGNSKGENKHFGSFKKGTGTKGGTPKKETNQKYRTTSEGEKVVNGYVIGKSGSGGYTVYNNSGHYEKNGQAYKTEEDAIKRAKELKKGIAVGEDDGGDLFSKIDDFAKDDQLKKGITSQQAYDEMLKGKDIWDALSVDGHLDTALRDKIIDQMTQDLNLTKEDWAKVGVTIYDPNEWKPQPKPKTQNTKPKPKEKTGLKAFDDVDSWGDNEIKEVSEYLKANPDVAKKVEQKMRDEHKTARTYYPDDAKFNQMVDEDLEGQLASLNDMSNVRFLDTLPRDHLLNALEETIREKNKKQKPLQYSREYDGLDKEFDVASPQETANLMGRDVDDNGKLYKPQSKAKKVTYNGKDYDVDSTAYNGAIINAFGTSITDESKLGIGGSGNGYTVFEDGDEIWFKTFDEAYNHAKKNEKKKASNLFGVEL